MKIRYPRDTVVLPFGLDCRAPTKLERALAECIATIDDMRYTPVLDNMVCTPVFPFGDQHDAIQRIFDEKPNTSAAIL